MFILNDEKLLRLAKTQGFSDKMIAKLINKEDNLELTQNDICGIILIGKAYTRRKA